MIKKFSAFVSIRAIILTYAYGTSKVLAIKKPSFIGSFMYTCEHYPFYALSKSQTSGKGACDLGEGVPSSTLSTKAFPPCTASRQKFQDPPLNSFDVARKSDKSMQAGSKAPRAFSS